MFFYQVDETLHGFAFRNIEFHRFFAHVEINLRRCASHIAEVRIGHFTRAVDDTAHHGDPHSLEVTGGGADFLGGGLEIEERAPAGWAGDVVRFENAGAGGLENIIGQTEGLAGRGLATDEDRIANAIAEKGTDVLGSGKQCLEEIRFTGRWIERVLEQDGVPWIRHECKHAEGMDRCEAHFIRNGDEAGLRFRIE